ncbi:MAG: hypothetical protein QOE65_1870 [Solirubrobacteraceae bacterium]|jgi:hypothetical protein|nr:hypothetical protein [Solirubrobacteraceae bacterium]
MVAALAVALAVPAAAHATLTTFDPPRSGGAPALRKAYTEHLGQLITEPGRGGVNELGGPLGIRGTDLGASFEVGGRLAVLFGDSWVPEGAGGINDDSLARTTATGVARFAMPKLTFAHFTTGAFAPLRVPGVSLGGLEVPVEGFVVGSRAYVFFASGWHEPPAPQAGYYDWSVLASGPANDLRASTLQFVHRFPSRKFLNVSVVPSGGWLYIYGAGNPYRQSRVYLARVPASQVGNRSAWRYFRGTRAGQPVFTTGESTAAAITPDPCVGELSVRRHPATGLYLMAYNCGGGSAPRGYHLRTARTPWGPWSRAERIFDTSPEDGGYGVSQHFALGNYRADSDTWEVPDDGLAEPDSLGAPPKDVADPAPTGRGVFGGEYGPYMVPRWFRTYLDGRAFSIVYMHSTWNPYKVHLMRTIVTLPGVRVRRPTYGAGLPAPHIVNGDFRDGLNGWTAIGDPFHPVPAKGRMYATSFGFENGGDRNQGALFQDFTLDDKVRTIAFRVHGGYATPGDFQRRSVASVRLYHHGAIVRETFGLNTNDRDVNAEWNVEEFRGEPLRLVIADNATVPWGFITATGFELRP